MKEILD